MSRSGGRESDFEELLKRELSTSELRPTGASGGGCISEGSSYHTDAGKVFIKVNRKENAKLMFDGEAAGLAKIHDMEVVKVPTPMKVVTIPSGGAALVMENLDIVGGLSSHSATLGEQLARLHMKNTEIAAKVEREESSVHRDTGLQAVMRFGFDRPTCCGYIAQGNQWQHTWEKFYAEKIQEQINLLPKKDSAAVKELWAQVLEKFPKFFMGLEIFPALLHGDLWNGNAAETADGPVVFDAASFYGHSEFDLAISHLFGGFSRHFFDGYFKVIPKDKGFEKRLELYKLFHYLNHWNHFGGGYKSSSLSTLQCLVKTKFD